MNYDPLVFVIILNYNGWQNTIECLESLRRLKYPNYRIVVIDNGSTDGSIEKIKKWAAGNIRVSSKNFRDNYPVSDVKWIEYDRRIAERGGLRELEDEIEYLSSNRKIVLIRIGVNLGYAGGNNVGVKYAIMRGAKYLWLLNNDTVVDDDALTEMIRFSGNKTNGIVGCKLLYYDRPNVIQAAGGGRFYFWMGLSRHYGWLNRDDGRWNRIFRPHYVTGASMLIKNLCFNETGLFDETFFMYGEEVDWQLRAQRNGWGKIYCPTAIVYHKEGGSIGNKNPFTDFYATRANILLCRKYTPWTLPAAIFFNILRAIRRLFSGHWKLAVVIIWGIVAGVKSRSQVRG